MLESGDPENYPRLGLWEKWYEGDHARTVYDDPATAKVAGGFLSRPNISVIEDWGCGLGGFKLYIGDTQRYVGVDGSKSRYVDLIADLEVYQSSVDAIHMRHTLEHNTAYRAILSNALTSFHKRMVLTLFTPFQDTSKIIATYPNFNDSGKIMIDLGFARQEIIDLLGECLSFSIENIPTKTQYGVEHMFFLEKSS
jgi:hypothetical protein